MDSVTLTECGHQANRVQQGRRALGWKNFSDVAVDVQVKGVERAERALVWEEGLPAAGCGEEMHLARWGEGLHVGVSAAAG